MDSSSMEDLGPNVPEIDKAKSLTVITYLSIFCLTLIIYDILLTLSRELDYVWSTRWTIMKVLYLIQRYLAVADVGAFVVFRLIHNWSQNWCTVSGQILYGILLLGVSISEAILALRTYAVWNSKRYIAIILGVMYAAYWIPFFTFVGLNVQDSLGYVSAELNHRCFIGGGSIFIVAAFSVLLTFDIAVSVMMIIPAWKMYQTFRRRTRLFSVVYEQGILYYVYTVGLTLSMVIILGSTRTWLAGGGENGIFPSLPAFEGLLLISRSMYSILTSRIVLGINDLRRPRSRSRSGLNGPSSSDETWVEGPEEQEFTTFAGNDLQTDFTFATSTEV